MSKIQLLLDVVEDMRSLADSIQAVADAMLRNEAPDEDTAPASEPVTVAPSKEVEASKAPPEKAITLEEVRAALAEKSRDGKTEEVRALLQKYGAVKLSGINPGNYKALMADAEVL